MITVLKNATATKARKEHRCSLCGLKINTGETYIKSTFADEGVIYDWKVHESCEELVDKLKMYDWCEDGVTDEDFREIVKDEYLAIHPELPEQKETWEYKLQVVKEYHLKKTNK